jgi:hypothetical protein
MDDLKLTGKSEEEFQKQMQVITSSVVISIRNLDLKNVQRWYSRKEN